MNRLGPARTDHARVERGPVPRRAEAFGWRTIEIDGHDVAAIDAAYPEARPPTGPTHDRRAHREGPRRLVPRRPEGWHGKAVTAEQAGAAIEELGRHPVPHDHAARARADSSPSTWASCTREPRPRLRRSHRHPQGVRRDAGLARGPSSRPRRPRRRGRQLHPHRGLPGRRAGAVRRDVTSPSRPWSARRRACRRSGRRPFAATFGAFFTRAYGLRAHGRDQPRRPPALRLARRRLDRRGRAVADGARGPRDACAPCTARPCCTRPTATPRCSWSPPCATPGHLLPPDDPRGDAARSTAPTRSSRSAGRRRCARRRDDRVTLVGAGVTLHECLGAADVAGRRGHRRPRDRLLLRQADRRRDAADARSTRPACSSWSRTTGSKAASATRCWTRSPRPVRSGAGRQARRSRTCPDPARPTELRAWAGIDEASIADARPLSSSRSGSATSRSDGGVARRRSANAMISSGGTGLGEQKP